eukprot:gene13214-biopygen17007
MVGVMRGGGQHCDLCKVSAHVPGASKQIAQRCISAHGANCAATSGCEDMQHVSSGAPGAPPPPSPGSQGNDAGMMRTWWRGQCVFGGVLACRRHGAQNYAATAKAPGQKGPVPP